MEEANQSGQYFNHKSLLSMKIYVHVLPQEWQQTDVNHKIFSLSLLLFYSLTSRTIWQINLKRMYAEEQILINIDPSRLYILNKIMWTALCQGLLQVLRMLRFVACILESSHGRSCNVLRFAACITLSIRRTLIEKPNRHTKLQ